MRAMHYGIVCIATMQQDIATVHLGKDRSAGCKATIKQQRVILQNTGIEIRCFSAQKFYLALLNVRRFYQ